MKVKIEHPNNSVMEKYETKRIVRKLIPLLKYDI